MKEKKKDIVVNYELTGPCQIDIDELESQWDHRFLLSQWQEDFRLIKYSRRGSGATDLKVAISGEQAQEVIRRLKLVRTQGMFSSAGSWRKEGQSELDMLPRKKGDYLSIGSEEVERVISMPDGIDLVSELIASGSRVPDDMRQKLYKHMNALFFNVALNRLGEFDDPEGVEKRALSSRLVIVGLIKKEKERRNERKQITNTQS